MTQDLSGSGYNTGRLPQSTVNNQRFSAAEPIDNQVIFSISIWIFNRKLHFFSGGESEHGGAERWRDPQAFGENQSSSILGFGPGFWSNYLSSFGQLGKLDFGYVAPAFGYHMKPGVIFWCIFINYYI